MKCFFLFCVISLPATILLHAECGSNCGEVDVDRIIAFQVTDQHVELGAKVLIDHYDVPENGSQGAIDLLMFETDIKDPDLKIKKNKPFEVAMYLQDLTSLQEGQIDIDFGCGTKEVVIDGHTLNLSDEESNYYVEEMGKYYTPVVDLSSLGLDAWAWLESSGCGVRLSISFNSTWWFDDDWILGGMDAQFSVEIIDPEAANGCPMSDYGSTDEGGFGGSANGNGAAMRDSPTWNSANPTDATDLDN